jgi:pimeloyl-ACP methyl ester carboxylesterase
VVTTSPRLHVRNDGAGGTVVPVRAREPDRSGYVVRSGVRLYYEVFGDGPTTVLLLPAWAIVHSRMWKMQVPYLARHFRVVTYDPRGNGRSDRPLTADEYADTELVADAVAVLDATGTATAVGVGLSMGAGVLLRLAADHPDRVAGAVFAGPAVPLAPPAADPREVSFEQELDEDEGWAKYNAHYWRRDLSGFAEFFFAQAFVEAHSSKHTEDAVGWALETDAETLIATARAPYLPYPVAVELAGRVRCPSLVVHGDQDRIVGGAVGPALAAVLGVRVEIFEGGGHCVQARHPVRFNRLLRDFVESVAGPS